MDPLVHQHTATAAGTTESRVARNGPEIRAAFAIGEAQLVAQLATRHQRGHFGDVGEEPARQPHGEDALRLCRGGGQLIGVGPAGDHRFLGEDMAAGNECGEPMRDMQTRRRGDERELDRAGGIGLGWRTKNLRRRKFAPKLAGACGVVVHERRDSQCASSH